MSHTNSQPTRDAMIAKIQKLQAMTKANGASETEATLALQKIASYMAEWNITQDEASVRREGRNMLKTSFRVMDGSPTEWRECLPAINQLFTVKSWGRMIQEDILGLGRTQTFLEESFFGFPADVAAAVAMIEIVMESLYTETAKFLAGQKGQPKRQREELSLAFRYGFTIRLKDRIKELIPPPPSQQSTGTALVVLKGQLVLEEFAKLGLTFKKRRSPTINLNTFGFLAGQRAGSTVDLGAAVKVSGTRAIGQGS